MVPFWPVAFAVLAFPADPEAESPEELEDEDESALLLSELPLPPELSEEASAEACCAAAVVAAGAAAVVVTVASAGHTDTAAVVLVCEPSDC